MQLPSNPELAALEEWRQRQLKVARYIQGRMLQVMRAASPMGAAAAARAYDRAAMVEHRLLAWKLPTSTDDPRYQRWVALQMQRRRTW